MHLCTFHPSHTRVEMKLKFVWLQMDTESAHKKCLSLVFKAMKNVKFVPKRELNRPNERDDCHGFRDSGLALLAIGFISHWD
jgi:hypothetical protein